MATTSAPIKPVVQNEIGKNFGFMVEYAEQDKLI